MSQENVDIVRRIYEMWRTYEASDQGKLALPELLDEDFEWVPDERFTLSEGPIRGRENVQRYFEGLIESIHFFPELEELFDRGDQVLAFVRVRGRGNASGVELDVRNAQLWTLRQGKAVRGEAYADRDRALEAAGLSE
jgi:ketosteroid isomerase-like protein